LHRNKCASSYMSSLSEIQTLRDDIRVHAARVARAVSWTNRALQIKGINTGQGEMTEERARFNMEVRQLLSEGRTTLPNIFEKTITRDQLYQRKGRLALVMHRCNAACAQFVK
jgi:hypothetical protein